MNYVSVFFLIFQFIPRFVFGWLSLLFVVILFVYKMPVTTIILEITIFFGIENNKGIC